MRSPRTLWARRYRLPRRLVLLASVSVALVVIGTLGYRFIEKDYRPARCACT